MTYEGTPEKGSKLVVTPNKAKWVVERDPKDASAIKYA